MALGKLPGTAIFDCRPAVSAFSDQAILRDFLQETGWQRCRGASVQHSLPGITDGQRLLCTGDCHIAQPPLLFHFLRISNGTHSGEQAVLKAHEEHIGKFQSLCRVHGHHDNGIIAVIVLLKVSI